MEEKPLWGWLDPPPPPLVKEGLSRIEFIFAIKVSWDNRHKPHTSLLWLLSQHINQSETSITPLS